MASFHLHCPIAKDKRNPNCYFKTLTTTNIFPIYYKSDLFNNNLMEKLFWCADKFSIYSIKPHPECLIFTCRLSVFVTRLLSAAVVTEYIYFFGRFVCFFDFYVYVLLMVHLRCKACLLKPTWFETTTYEVTGIGFTDQWQLKNRNVFRVRFFHYGS